MACNYNIDWIFPKLKYPSKLWRLASYPTVGIVGFCSKIIIEYLNNTRKYNIENLVTQLDKRPPGIPLLTISNHDSCFDDPGMWGLLNLRHACNANVIRWSPAAHDICFTNKLHSWFFMIGKGIPIVRGAGVYQPAIDLCIEKLKIGEWVHIFPEAKVNLTHEPIRFKWGVGRIIYESPILPIIIPIWHVGMHEVLPSEEPPYIFRFGKKVTYNFGKPIDLSQIIQELRESNVCEKEARRVITEKIQEAMFILRDETKELHNKS